MGSGGSKRLQIVQPRVNVTPFIKILKTNETNGIARGETGFPRPNLCISPPLSVCSLLFLFFTVVRKCPYTKKAAMLQITVLWFDASLTCEGTSLPTFWSCPRRVCQLKFYVWRLLKGKEWINAIRWDEEKEFTIAAGTNGCLLRFRIEDLRKIV